MLSLASYLSFPLLKFFPHIQAPQDLEFGVVKVTVSDPCQIVVERGGGVEFTYGIIDGRSVSPELVLTLQ